MTRFSDAAMLTGDYAHLAAEMRAGDRSAPKQKDWDKTSCDNSAEEAAQEVAKHIFAFQQSIDADKEQLEILTYSAAGQMKVLAIHPGDGELIRIDGVLMPQGKPASVVQHASLMAVTFVTAPLAKKEEEKDGGLKIGFVIFDELKERQKARYGSSKAKPKNRKDKKLDLTKPFGLPPIREAAAKKGAPKKAAPKKETKKAEPKVEAKAAAPKATGKADDLKKVEGIGPKIASTLVEAGITTFSDLAKATPEAISEIISGVRGNHVTDTWPAQAQLAADGKWDELKKWQDELDGGKA